MNPTICRAVLPLLPMLAMLAGCASAPRYDARFGNAVRQARSAMTINPRAGAMSEPAAGIDGQAAHDAMLRYQDSFKAPPPVITVINAGGPAAR
ncbi:hypothetical protein IV454_10825 [Massilia antarctica]|uniref:Pilus assembly protein n=1 Tax=Massilia antarctica TaxID=2765360 RepID=A0AA48WIR5_9BURK|nr:hypothetical protein [Massilia antarctica]QPI51940.1 hypothetical protein IV454_10825 [Massilia antarctica]